MSKAKPVEYRSGSIYPRKDGRWVGVVEAGYTATGARKRVTVTGKTESIVKRRLRDKQAEVRAGRVASERLTVKTWADEYLAIRVRELRPKAYNAAANPIRKWVVPTIGRKRLEDLTPRDVRAVADAQRAADRQPADTHRVLLTMLRRAVQEGHHVPSAVLAVKAPKSPPSDREAMTIDQGIACLKVAEDLPHGSRWLFTLLYGQRLGECLGLTRDALNFDMGDFGEAAIEWQLQTLPYNRPRDRSSGFRVPDDHEARHLHGALHLVRPKTGSGKRLASMEGMAPLLLAWRTIAPSSPYGLVWPRPDGRGRDDKADRQEWRDLQDEAQVACVDGTAGRRYELYEARHTAATLRRALGADDETIMATLGHASILSSKAYLHTDNTRKGQAQALVAEALGVTAPPA